MTQKGKNREKGTGSIYQKGNHFFLKIRAGGEQKTTILLGKDGKPVTSRQEAERAARILRPILLAEQKEEIALHIANAKKMKPIISFPITQIWEKYLAQYRRPDSSASTLNSYQKILKCFIGWLSKIHPEVQQTNAVSEGIVEEYFSYVWNIKRLSGRTFNSYLQALKLIFKHIQTDAGIEKNPFEHIIKKPVLTESRQAFTEDQVKAIFNGFDNGFFYKASVNRLGKGRKHEMVERTMEYKPMYADEMRVLLMLCCWTGCRGQDGAQMRWKNINFFNNTITYVPQKTARKTNNRPVSLPLHPDLKAALHEAEAFRGRNQNGEDYIIPSVARRFLYNSNGVQKDVLKIIYCATGCATTASELSTHRALKANIYSLHSFRHTFVSFCANAGVSLDVVASIVGHGSSAMTRHYAHISDAAKANAVNALPVLQDKSDEIDSDLVERVAALTEEQRYQLLQQLEAKGA